MAVTAKAPSHSPDFWSIAKTLGHEEALKAGSKEVRTTITLESLDHARAVFSRADAEERAKRQAIFFDRIAHRQRHPDGRHDRAFSYILAAGELTRTTKLQSENTLSTFRWKQFRSRTKLLGPMRCGTSAQPPIRS